MTARSRRLRRITTGLIGALLIGAAPSATPSVPLVDDGAPTGGATAEELLALTADLRTGVLKDEAAYLEERISEHLYFGQALHNTYKTTEQLPGEIVAADGYRDTAIFTGIYLAGEAWRYGVVKHEMETARNRGIATAKANELARVKERVDVLVDAIHLKANIARNWKADGAASPEGYNYQPGIVDGRAGMLMRNCTPTSAPEWQWPQRGSYAGPQSVFGPLEWDGKRMPWESEDGPRPTYWCEDDTSRDSYIGTLMGLVAALDVVSVDDQAMREQIRDDLYAMAGYHATTQGWMVYPYLRYDPDNDSVPKGLDPLFVHGPQPRLHLMQTARHAAHVAGSDLDRVQWDVIWAKEYGEFGPNYVNEQIIGLQDANGCYFCHNLNHVNSFDLISLETDEAARENFREGLAVLDSMTGDDMNAWFEAIVFALTRDAQRLEWGVQHLREWIDYRVSSNDGVHNSDRCGVDITCVPEDQADYYLDTPQGEIVVVKPGTSATLRASEPLEIVNRVPNDFLWQWKPTQLDRPKSPRRRLVGYDFTAPYWMLRYFAEVAPPTYDPLPTWAGPSAR